MQNMKAARLKKILNFLKSPKLAVAMIVLLIILFLTATFVPQGQAETFYLTHYPGFIARLIILTHYYNFYRSSIFLIPLFLFFINLIICTFSRIIARFLHKAPLRFGPDLIHISILLFIASGIASLRFQEQEVVIPEGGSALLSSGHKIEMFHQLSIPKDLAENSSIDLYYKVSKNGVLIKEGWLANEKILEFDNFIISRQPDFWEQVLILKDENLEYYELKPGIGFRMENRNFIFKGISPEYSRDQENKHTLSSEFYLAALFVEQESDIESRTIIKNRGDKIGPFIVHDLLLAYRFIIKEKSDAEFIIGAGVLFICGLGLTFLQKTGDTKL
ncbi:MAG: cytochrome c biogenesis protein ResB [Spirochaetales bacterium]|nr:cytochrome c biogenesis protein ResB [Spirochaetales bacterium]